MIYYFLVFGTASPTLDLLVAQVGCFYIDHPDLSLISLYDIAIGALPNLRLTLIFQTLPCISNSAWDY